MSADSQHFTISPDFLLSLSLSRCVCVCVCVCGGCVCVCVCVRLRRAVFKDKILTIRTKRVIYQACVLSILLYGAECWSPLQRHIRKLNAFHHRCIRAVLGITRRQQWAWHLSSHALRVRWGDPEPVSIIVTKHRLEWLDHTARMQDHHIPKKLVGYHSLALLVVPEDDGGT